MSRVCRARLMEMFMALPQAVLAAEAKADELYAQMYSSKEESTGEQLTSSEPDQEAPVDLDPAPSQRAGLPDDQERVGSQEESPAIESGVDEDSWENRYKILTGKYSAEVPALAAEKRELRYKLNQLEKELERIKSQPAPERLVKDEEIQEYGESLVDLGRGLQ